MAQAKEKKQEVNLSKILLPLGCGTLLLALFALAFYQLYDRIGTVTSDLIVEQVEELSDIFARIEKTAGIISFEHEKNYIDFLTVTDFVGSEVGSLNLRNPEGWEGPYLDDNFTIHEKYYVVVNSDQGYYIVPDDGVQLSNGKVIGEDIPLNKNTDFEELTNNPDGLMHNNQPLARRIK